MEFYLRRDSDVKDSGMVGVMCGSLFAQVGLEGLIDISLLEKWSLRTVFNTCTAPRALGCPVEGIGMISSEKDTVPIRAQERLSDGYRKSCSQISCSSISAYA